VTNAEKIFKALHNFIMSSNNDNNTSLQRVILKN